MLLCPFFFSHLTIDFIVVTVEYFPDLYSYRWLSTLVVFRRQSSPVFQAYIDDFKGVGGTVIFNGIIVVMGAL